MRITVSPKATIVLPSLEMYLSVVGIPLFFLTIDSISAWMSQAELFSESAINVTLVLLVIMFFSSLKCVFVTDVRLSSWSVASRSFRVLLKDIHHIDAAVVSVYRRSTMGMAMPATRLIVSSGKPVVTRRIDIDHFNKMDIAYVLKKIVEHAPHVVLNDDARLLSEGDTTHLQKMVTSVRWNTLRQVVIVLFAVLVFVGVIFLI